MVAAGFKIWISLRARLVQNKFGLSKDWRKQAIRIARQRFTDPNDIALFGISKPEELDLYIRRFEYGPIFRRINPPRRSTSCPLTNKLLFGLRCMEHSLPHAPTLATIVDGNVRVIEPPLQRSLVLKPAEANGGRGVQFFELGDLSGLPEHLKIRCSNLPASWLVQPKMNAHPDIIDLALNALPTVRITTILNEAGEPEIVTTVLRLPSCGDALVDNVAAGGLIAGVALTSGELGVAREGKGIGEHKRHPVSGGLIQGRRLPDWEAAQALVLRAHRQAFPEQVIVGWDVGVSDRGPILIEGNRNPGMIIAQRGPGLGIGATRFGELLAFQLKQSMAR